LVWFGLVWFRERKLRGRSCVAVMRERERERERDGCERKREGGHGWVYSWIWNIVKWITRKKKNKQRHVGGGCYCYLQYRWRFCLCERMNEVVFVPCFILLLREYIYFYTQNQIF